MFRAGGENPQERKERGNLTWQQGMAHTETQDLTAGETPGNSSMYMEIQCARQNLLLSESLRRAGGSPGEQAARC